MAEYSRSILKIDAGNLQHNYRHFSRLVGEGCNVAPSVKFSAYGLGASGVVKQLVAAGARDFYVFDYDEAMKIAEIDGVSRIFLYDGISSSNYKKVESAGFIPVLHTQQQIDLWSEFDEAPYCIMIDTGMNRTGLGFADGVEFLRNKKLHDPVFVLSHLACAEDKESKHNKRQLEQMQQIRQEFPNLKISFGNSAGVFLGEEYHFDQVRPGIGLYGGAQVNYDENIRNVVYLKAKVEVVRTIDEKNKWVGYGATYEVEPGSKIATLQIGYADGFPRSLSNNHKVFFNGYFLPVAGVVSMDYITIDVSEIPENELQDMKYVEIIGDHITVDEMADACDLTCYEVISDFICSRFKRFYE